MKQLQRCNSRALARASTSYGARLLRKLRSLG